MRSGSVEERACWGVKGIKDSFEGPLPRMSVLWCVCRRITRVKYAAAATLFAIATLAVIGTP